MIEEILLRMGLNSSAVSTGLRGVRGQVQSFAGDVTNLFKGLGSKLVGAVAVGTIASQFKRALDDVEKLSNTSENLGISTDFLQDIQNIGLAAGLTGQKIEAMMNKFVSKLPEGTDPQKALLDLADKLSKIKDPAERAREAIEAFGKSGINMLPILSKGSEAISKMAAEFDKLSQSEIKALQEADAALDKFENKWRIAKGRTAAAAVNILSGAEKFQMDVLDRQIQAAEALLDKRRAAKTAAGERQSPGQDHPFPIGPAPMSRLDQRRNPFMSPIQPSVERWNLDIQGKIDEWNARMPKAPWDKSMPTPGGNKDLGNLLTSGQAKVQIIVPE